MQGRDVTVPDDEQELLQGIEQTRERLGQTVEQLAAKTDMKGQARARARELAGRVKGMAARLRVKAGDGGAGVRRQVADRTVIAREKAAIRSRRGQPQRGRPLPKVCGARSARVLDPRASAGCHWRWARSC